MDSDCVSDIFVQPDLRRKRLTVTVASSTPGLVHARIENTPFEATGDADVLPVDFPDYEPWAPGSPRLYVLRCEVYQGDERVGRGRVRFGMREFSVKGKWFRFNHRPLFIKGVAHCVEGMPAGPEENTEEIVRGELTGAKDAGFNFIHVCGEPVSEARLDLADELGILVCEELPLDVDRVRSRILRNRNHPSLVAWSLSGEREGGEAQEDVERLWRLVRSLDPSRLILGGLMQTRRRHRSAWYVRPYSKTLEVYDNLRVLPLAPVDHRTERYLQHNGHPDRLSLVSIGGARLGENEREAAGKCGTRREQCLPEKAPVAQEGFQRRELSRIFGDLAGLMDAVREVQRETMRCQTNALRANTRLAGYSYYRLCEGAHTSWSGVLDRYRRPKPVAQAFKHAQAALRLLVQAPVTNLIPRQEVPVTVALVNEAQLEGRADFSLQVIGPTNQVLWKKKRNIAIPPASKEIWSGSISASGSPGTHKFLVRLIRDKKILGEDLAELHVFDPVQPCEVEIKVLDPFDKWKGRCLAYARQGGSHAPVYVVPPLANTIRAYPALDLVQVLAQVKEGAVALFFGPPDDWNELADRFRAEELHATPKSPAGCSGEMCHYVKHHPVFEGLPARGLMRQTYRNIAVAKTFVEPSDEDVCGAFDMGLLDGDADQSDGSVLWGSDILVRRYGSGRIVFTHLRVLENLGNDPAAERLFVNFLMHFSRRSVPTDEPLPLNQQALEWLRNERAGRVRPWMAIGAFPNWNGVGHETAYPPEQRLDFEKTYRGWYEPIAWKRWYSVAAEDYVVDLHKALCPAAGESCDDDYGTGYAYAEFTCDARQQVAVKLGVQNAMKVWLNKKLIYENGEQISEDGMEHRVVEATVKQGRNSLLVKVSKVPGPFRFSLDLESRTDEPLQLKRWK